ncbi:MAG: hypothetical protein ACYCQM_01455 [Acidithiobacillus sp.]
MTISRSDVLCAVSLISVFTTGLLCGFAVDVVSASSTQGPVPSLAATALSQISKTPSMFVGYLSKPATVKLVSTVRGFVWGHGKPQFTVFIDPNCVFCHQFYKDAVPLVESGKLTVRVVPVAILEQTSFTRAAEILSARRPLTWYLRNERHFVMPPIEQGGLSLKLPVSAVARSDVSHNNAIIRRLDQNHAATPTFVSPSGVVQVGLPAGEFSGLLKMMRSGGAQ